MNIRLHGTARCTCIFLALFGITFLTALLVDPVLHYSHWIESAEYAAGVSLTALLLDVVLNMTTDRQLFPSMLLQPCPADESKAGEEAEWDAIRHRRELVDQRLQMDVPCLCDRPGGPCVRWPFCEDAPETGHDSRRPDSGRKEDVCTWRQASQPRRKSID